MKNSQCKSCPLSLKCLLGKHFVRHTCKHCRVELALAVLIDDSWDGGLGIEEMYKRGEILNLPKECSRIKEQVIVCKSCYRRSTLAWGKWSKENKDAQVPVK